MTGKLPSIVEKKKIVPEEPLVVKGNIEKELPEEKEEVVATEETEATPNAEEETKE